MPNNQKPHRRTDLFPKLYGSLIIFMGETVHLLIQRFPAPPADYPIWLFGTLFIIAGVWLIAWSFSGPKA